MYRLQRGINSVTCGTTTGASRMGSISQGGGDRSGKSFEELKRIIHGKLVDKLDLSRVSDLAGDTLRREIRLVVERLCDTENPLLNRMERAGRWVIISVAFYGFFIAAFARSETFWLSWVMLAAAGGANIVSNVTRVRRVIG